MRRCFAGDLLTVAEALAPLPEVHRANVVRRLIHEAHAAHHYTKRLRKPHPQWGNGSLQARANAEPRSAPQPHTDWAIVALVANALAEFRNRAYLRSPA